jgi:hypothetical protein
LQGISGSQQILERRLIQNGLVRRVGRVKLHVGGSRTDCGSRNQ